MANEEEPAVEAELPADGSHLIGVTVVKGSSTDEEPVFATGETANPGQKFAGEGEHHPNRVSREQFFVAITIIFDTPGVIDKDWLPIAIKPQEADMAKAFSDGIYNLLEIWYPQALIIGSPTLANLGMCAPFVMATVVAFREVMQTKADKRNGVKHPNTEFENKPQPQPAEN